MKNHLFIIFGDHKTIFRDPLVENQWSEIRKVNKKLVKKKKQICFSYNILYNLCVESQNLLIEIIQFQI